jgi:AraC-like DNA-binding protein
MCNFSEIADLTGYKTAQHLSGQFKKIVGVSMLEYKAKNIKQRKSIDEI